MSCNCNNNTFRMYEGYFGPFFTPSVDADGNLTWTNNAGLPNPPTINIKGAKGDPGTPGSGALTDAQKQAILQLAQKVAYIDDQGQTYYDDLYDAFYGSAPAPTLTSITASYTQTGTIYTTDSVDVIPQRGTLVVAAHYDDGSSAAVASGYTLAGTLTEGTSTVTVSYQGLTTTITVQVTAVAGTYTIQNNLTGCTTSNSATTIAEGSSYSATITASVGYTLTGATATITMGGTELTGAFNNGTISIPNVTGNLVITVVATARTVSSISAVYTQSGTVYDTDSLDSLKADLVVTATYSDSGTAVVPSTDYTLSGTLVADTTSTITVSYSGETTTFDVVVSGNTIVDADILLNASEHTIYGAIEYDQAATYSFQYTFGTHTPVSSTTRNCVVGPATSQSVIKNGGILFVSDSAVWKYAKSGATVEIAVSQGDVLTIVRNFATGKTSYYLNDNLLETASAGAAYFDGTAKVFAGRDSVNMTVAPVHIKIAKGDLH